MAEAPTKPVSPRRLGPTRLCHLERFDRGTPHLAQMMRTSAMLRESYRGTFTPPLAPIVPRQPPKPLREAASR